MKQVFKANESLRRLLCALLVAIMVIGMIPLSAPKAAAVIGSGDKVYFKPSSDWKQDGAWFAACFHFSESDSGSGKFVKMEPVAGDSSVYACTIPTGGYTWVRFVRMNKDKTALSWDSKWNPTKELAFCDKGNLFTVNNGQWDNADGSWSNYTPPSGGGTNPTQPSIPSGTDEIAYLAGTMNDWSTTANPLTGSGNIGSVTIALQADTYEFKIVCDGKWYSLNHDPIVDSTGSNGLNTYENKNNFKLEASGGAYTFIFDKSTNKLVITHVSSGGGGGTIDPDTKLYVGTTFYDYRSDYEHTNGNGSLASRSHMTDANNQGWPYLYNFTKFNGKLSQYYSTNGVKVPIYMGHFQPDSTPGWYDYADYRSYDSNYSFLYGYSSSNEKEFMSVNNSLIDINKGWNDGHINSAAWGIVAPALDGDKLMAATNSGTIAHPLFDESFLKTKYDGKQLADIYSNVKFPFKQEVDKNGIEYWVFNSEFTTLKMAQNDDGYYLEEISNPGEGFKNRNHTGGISDGNFGFFPFNTGNETNASQYNYGYGMRLDIPFNLTADGKIANKYGDKQDVIYTFSGDDDVWVFIDGVLVLDIGGSHGKVTGEINFATKTATVSSVKASLGDTSPDDEEKSINGYQTKFTLPKDMAGEHTLTMFYMERGMWESNMSIRFNFIPASSLWAKTTSFTVQKQWNVTSIDNIPDSIDVQLQQRVSGATEWTNFGDSVELEQSDVSAQTTKVVWSHTWDDLPNFKEQTDNTEAALYEYRVVELAEGNKVLANGEKNNGMLVAYGEVVGSGASGYTQIISNNQVDNNVIVVIDFGLSVDATVATTDYGTLVGIGSTHKLPVGPSDNLDSTNFKDVVDGQFGTATVVTGADEIKRVRYTPNTMSMTGVDNIGFCVELVDQKGSKYNYGTLTVIPAANIYYEDDFLTFVDSKAAYDTYGNWVVVKDDGTIIVDKEKFPTSNGIQDEDRPGVDLNDALKELDADNVYGYDSAYNNCKKYSLGSAKMVTVDATTGAKDVAPKASFSFTGTGFDVVSLTDNTTGALWVEVFNKNGDRVKSYIVNSYYGYIRMLYEVKYIYDGANWVRNEVRPAEPVDGVDPVETPADFSNVEIKQGAEVTAIEYVWVVGKESENAIYQVPVIKVANLPYASYNVTISAIYMPLMDTVGDGHYSVYVDAIRIYDPANDSTSTENYVKDGESNPHLTTIKSLIIAANDFHNDGITKTMGAVFVDGKSGVVDIADYANQGPNNETYLLNGNAIAFKLGYTGTDKPVSPNNPNHYNNPDVTKPTLGIQIGAKLASGDRATMKITCGDKEKEITLTSATNMFYWLPEVTWNGTAGNYVSDPIVISCSAEDGILSLTDLKLTGDFATVVKTASTAPAAATVADLDAEIYAISDLNVYKAAAAAMTAVPEVVVPTITGKCFTLSFEDEIRVNFYYTVSDRTSVAEQGMLVFNTEPDQVDINNADFVYSGSTYVDSTGYCMNSTNGIAAKEMGDDRYYCAYAVLSDGTYVYSDTYQYSPKQYAVHQLEDSENENLHALCVAMLNYGAAAQRYFGYKTDALMNAGLTAEQQALVEAYNAELFTGAVAPDEAKIGSYTATETGFGTNSVTVSFEGAFAMNFYFDPDHEDSELNFCYWTKEAYENAQMLTGENATVNTLLEADENGIFHAPISGIAAKDLDDTIYVVATYTIDGETFCTGVIPYSISTYCKNLANGNSGELAQATAMYGFYAESYFG